MKLGIMCLANDSGLGNQTRRLTYMLRPSSIMVVNSEGFSKNKKQHLDWYDNFSGYKVAGFPTSREIRIWLKGLTHVLVAENPFNFYLISQAREMGIKTYVQSNYEFCDNLSNDHLPIPDKFLMPSYWHLDTMKRKFGEDRVIHLPPPIDPTEFKEARDENFKQRPHRTFLHVVGTLAAKDRNGTLSLLKALDWCVSDFTLVIKSQHDLPEEYIVNDRRVKYQIGNDESLESLYSGFDAMILPRRYGGLSLGCNEAMMAGLPVIMPNISPNDLLLPRDWLVAADKKETLQTRALIDVYEPDPASIAFQINKLCQMTDTALEQEKIHAFDLAMHSFAPSSLRAKYDVLWE